MEAIETAVRTAALAAGARVLEELLEPVGVGRRKQALACSCGAVMSSSGVRKMTLLTLLGPVRFARSRYACPACGKARFPGDELLGIDGTSRSPGVRRQVSRLGAKESFREVAQDMKALAGLSVSRKDAERVAEGIGEQIEAWQAQKRHKLRFQEPPPPETPKPIDTLYIEFDGTGAPMVHHEVAGRKGKQADGSAKTREAKVGCVFTQTDFDKRGRPMRDPASTTFVGAIEKAAPFGHRIYAEAVERGLFKAKRVIVLGDGAEWVKNLAATHFGHGTFIIDYYHATEHIGDLARALVGRDLRQLDRCQTRWRDYLYDGNIESILEQARAYLPKDPRAYKEARTQINYFDKNKNHMRYGYYRAQGLFIGSGVIEAACKNVIGQRLKNSGMEWTVRGANAIIALRCAELSKRTETFWENQAAS